MVMVTFNIEKRLVDFVKQTSKKQGKTQKQVLEDALELQRKQYMKQIIKEESKNFWNTGKDEMLLITNSGLDEYNNSLKKNDNA